MRQMLRRLSAHVPTLRRLMARRGDPAAAARPWRHPPLPPEEVAAFRRRIAEIHWFHSMDLGHGLRTSGPVAPDELQARLSWLRFPEDLSGQSFLDIAAWDGFYSFEAEQRGAARVLATDHFCWHGPGWGSKAGFLLAREALRSRVEDRDVDVMDVCREAVGEFDVVLFSGIFYHLRDPLRALANAASVARKLLLVETAVGFLRVREPVMGYLPRQPGNEGSNYWRPNPALIRLLLREQGFTRVECRLREEAPGAYRGFFDARR
jgi:tRNA (mo5U34)-methyltransferase